MFNKQNIAKVFGFYQFFLVKIRKSILYDLLIVSSPLNYIFFGLAFIFILLIKILIYIVMYYILQFHWDIGILDMK